MDSSGLNSLNTFQKAALKRGNLADISEIMLSSSQEVARKCKISAADAQTIIDSLYQLAPEPSLRRLEDVKYDGEETCTTGDLILDGILGGGIRPGMVWEVAGERLPTSRLVQIMEANTSLAGSDCDLKDVHTLSTPTIPHLIHVLSERLTPFIESQADKPGFKPVRLLVIDALAELFHTSDKTTTRTLVERSKNISQISFLLHSLARKHRIAVLVLNEVVDVFDRSPGPGSQDDLMLSYSEQSRWFCRAHSIHGEDKKEISLGMVWANQVNARILLSRTGRRRYLDDTDSSSVKRLKTADFATLRPAFVQTNTDLALIRRLSIVFSSVSLPASLDYVVTKAGISILPNCKETGCQVEEDDRRRKASSIPDNKILPDSTDSTAGEDALISPLDMGTVEDGKDVVQDFPRINEDDEDDGPPEDEWDHYWATNTITEVELDAFDSNTQTS
ncbi:hypothetical protein H0H87_006557 [Tephrocybe sp. NHM501043]|nr:hypothetical protein H0H87_006557 [Tephrocybe sp. NHM501043]